ncbi:DUF3558 domain-containing protein [Rhodococcus sp. SGAir0479]|uniref:DUF3558 domain-containing protein n=1 Tax=Rhodococcus sp. SGAir0479 TaxID=2567884 RepID=UPI0010CD1460|nr:DUF3558 domain-containing protein [Rhodococcus sp. SGAir0479]
MRGSAVIGLIAAGLLVAGCGSGTVSGEADAEGTAAGEPVFSPCDDIPSDLLRQVQVDPNSPDRDFGGVDYPGWNRCRWPGRDFSVSVLATTLPLDDIRTSDKTVEERDQQIQGRPALVYRDTSDVRRERCNVAVSTGSASSIVRVSVYHPDQGPEPCELAMQTAAVLSPAVPG